MNETPSRRRKKMLEMIVTFYCFLSSLIYFPNAKNPINCSPENENKYFKEEKQAIFNFSSRKILSFIDLFFLKCKFLRGREKKTELIMIT
jgi:hypothetical protein